MKFSLPHFVLGLGCFCASTQFLGCMPAAGRGTFPIGYPGQPIGGYNPYPYPVGYPPFPGSPGIPIVMNPTPSPGTPPTSPGIPGPNPNPIPTIPIGNPVPLPAPSEPGDDSTAFWSPWPLPPRGNQLAARSVSFEEAGVGSSRNNVDRQRMMQNAGSTANHDLKYRGGRIIRDLFYVNLYVSGDTQWSASDVERIDRSLSAAMRDEHLNNVLLQYYDNQPISATALPSHPLVGYTPKTVSRGDLQNYVTWLHRQGFLRSYDLRNTVFNFLLPPGTVLTADDRAADSQQLQSDSRDNSGAFNTPDIVPKTDETDSLKGLGGYHGSVVIDNGGRIYFTVEVHSQRLANGTTNGIPVFREPWKNVVATLYHQLVETRTDPDVEDAIRNSSDLDADRYLGWVSDSGLEIGDLPLQADIPITDVVREVPLADGSGMVPVQLQYSNFVHGAEGPIPQPH